MKYQDFLNRMKEIKKMGWVSSHREGDTGIGKTLEDLLGIDENNIAGPDFETYELKSARRDSVSMLTLFTKAPLPNGANASLLEAFGYPGRTGTSEEKELHVTVDSIRPNSVGLMLEVKDNKLYISNKKGVIAFYTDEGLKESFEAKYNNLLHVLADSKGDRGNEYFWFNEASLLQNFSFKRFSELVREGKLKVDLRMGHYPNGKPHDHGTGFRILPRYLPDCFANIQRIV